MAEPQRVGPGFAPVAGPESRVLILGSFPSVKSREVGFYYGHPQNRFWPLLAALLHKPVHGAEAAADPAKRAGFVGYGVLLHHYRGQRCQHS